MAISGVHPESSCSATRSCAPFLVPDAFLVKTRNGAFLVPDDPLRPHHGRRDRGRPGGAPLRRPPPPLRIDGVATGSDAMAPLAAAIAITLSAPLITDRRGLSERGKI